MKLNKAIVYLVTLTLFYCSFVSCRNSSKDSETSATEQSESETAEKSLIVGTWDLDPECYEGAEYSGEKIALFRLNLKDDNKASVLIAFDYSDSIYLTNKKLYIDGDDYKIKSYDKKELVFDIDGEEITFVRTSKSSRKYGEYYVPDEFGWREGTKIVFEENEKTMVKMYAYGEYEYDDKSGELIIELEDAEDDDDDNGPATIEFLDEDTILLHGSAGEDVKMFRVK